MTYNGDSVGEGRSWAILNAQGIAEMPVLDGLATLSNHAVIGAGIYESSSVTGHPTQVKNCQHFASAAGQIIDVWQANDADRMPEAHADFLKGLSPHEKRQASDFDPDEPKLAVALQRLRVVRLALPQLLQHTAPNRALVRRPVSDIALQLAKVCLPGAFRRSRQPSSSYAPSYTRTLRPDW